MRVSLLALLALALPLFGGCPSECESDSDCSGDQVRCVEGQCRELNGTGPGDGDSGDGDRDAGDGDGDGDADAGDGDGDGDADAGDGDGDGDGDAGDGDGDGDGDGTLPTAVIVLDPSDTIEPLANVLMVGTASTPGMGATVSGYTWTLLSRPLDSRAVITSPAGATTGFSFAAGTGLREGIDVLGDYQVELLVMNDLGQSSAPTQVVIHALPEATLFLQLTWDTPVGDLDLHLRREADTWCGSSGVYYANKNPDWDNSGTENEGDPKLLIDDIAGFGPEAIELPTPAPDTYRAAVHLFTSELTGPINANLNVYLNGALFARYQRTFLDGDRYWEVADIVFPGFGTPYIDPVDLVNVGSPCD